MKTTPALLALCLALSAAHTVVDAAEPACTNPVYLTIDPGSMDYAPRVSEILRRQQVRATFWVSNQSTQNGEGSMGNAWGAWWKQMAQQGHEFGSQTYDHATWRGDLPGYKPTFRIKIGSGGLAGREFTYDPTKYCEQITHAAERMQDFTGKKTLPLFHPPGGMASAKLLAAANACGYLPVGIAKAGVFGRNVPVKNAVAGIQSGDVLLLELGTSATAEPWAMANLEPLIQGLKERGMCFASLRQQPTYRDWIASHGG